MSCDGRYTVLIATYLEPECVERIRAVSTRLDVIYEPDLIGKPRYPADHYSLPSRTLEQEARWRELLRRTHIQFDIDYTHKQDLPDLAPKLRWLQGTSAGIGKVIQSLGYDERLPNTIFTSASGVHARPLAEFCLMGMLAHAKGLQRMIANQGRHRWERYAGTELPGRTLGIVGMGKIGKETARLAKAMGMNVLGVKRTVERISPESLYVDEIYSPRELHVVLRRSEYLVLVAPHTDETEHMIGAAELALLPRGACFINIGRGILVDEPALIAALQSDHIGSAVLDVAAREPLPEDSVLWDMPNVLVSPHSGSTSDRENARVTDLFCQNLQQFLAGKTLINVVDTAKRY